MIFLRSLFFNILLFGGIAFASIIALPLLFFRDKHMICAAKVLSRYVGFLLRIFIDVTIDFKGTENLKKFDKYFIYISIYNTNYDWLLRLKKRI